MAMAVIENLRGFAHSRPPLIVFMICMGLFGVVLLSLAYYIKMNQVENPDISQDWNVFLENFSELEFCMTNQSNAIDMGIPFATKPKQNVELTTVNPNADSFRNYSVRLTLTVTPTQDFLKINHNITYVYGAVYGRQLGLKESAADELINMTAELPFDWNATRCGSRTCKTVKIVTCVHFSAPAYVFPVSRSPPVCENMNETGVEYHTQLRAYEPHTIHDYYLGPTYYCKSHSVVKISYMYDPRFTVYLSMHDRSVINLHLMHTSYFLFVMVVTLFCYALIRGNPRKKEINEALLSNSATA